MRYSTHIYLLAILLAGCERNETVAPRDELASSTDPSFTFVAPTGFEWKESERIFYNPELRASISLAHSPSTSFESVANDFNADNMQAANMELLAKDTLDIDGRPTLKVMANRLAGPYPQKTLTAVFATDTGCAQITAIYPATMDASGESELVTAVTTAIYR